MKKNDYEILLKRLLINIITQLPQNCILAIDMPELAECVAFKKLKDFQIQDSFSEEAVFPDYYYLISRESIACYFKLIIETDLVSFLCHYMIYKKNEGKRDVLAVVYDSCIFNLSDEIVIDPHLIEQCKSEGIFVSFTDIS